MMMFGVKSKYPVFFLVLLLLSVASRANAAQTVEHTAGSGTLIAAALETAGYKGQEQILSDLEKMLETLGGLIYLCVIIAGVFSMAVTRRYQSAIWMLVGPAIFVYASGIKIDGMENKIEGAAVRWQFGHFQDGDNVKDDILGKYQTNSLSKVSYLFHKYNELVSEVIQKIITTITNDSILPQMLFMARQKVLEDVFNMKGFQDDLLAMIAYFQAHCHSEIYFARLVALGVNDDAFYNSAEYAYAAQQYCERFPKMDKPFVPGHWYDYAVGNNFFADPSTPRDKHIQLGAQGTGVVSCAMMWAWIVKGAKENADKHITGSVTNALPAIARRISDTNMSINADQLEKMTKKDVQDKVVPPPSTGPTREEPCRDKVDASTYLAMETFDFNDLNSIVASEMIDNSLNRNPAEQILMRVYNQANITGEEAGENMVRARPGTSQAVVRAQRAHQYSETRKMEFYYFVNLMPYLQGLILFALAVSYPFFAMVLLMPGRSGGFITWLSLWAWAKSWDIGYAFVMIADQILWELMPKSSFYNAEKPQLYDTPASLLAGVYAGDHSYSLATYWAVLSTLMLAIPLVSAKAILSSKAAMVNTMVSGFNSIGTKIVGPGTTKGGMDSLTSMRNSLDPLREKRITAANSLRRQMNFFKTEADKQIKAAAAGSVAGKVMDTAKAGKDALSVVTGPALKELEQGNVAGAIGKIGERIRDIAQNNPASPATQAIDEVRAKMLEAEKATGKVASLGSAIIADQIDNDGWLSNGVRRALSIIGDLKPDDNGKYLQNALISAARMTEAAQEKEEEEGQQGNSVIGDDDMKRVATLMDTIRQTQELENFYGNLGDLSFGGFLAGDWVTGLSLGTASRKAQISLAHSRYKATGTLMKSFALLDYFETSSGDDNARFEGWRSATSMRRHWSWFVDAPTEVWGDLLKAERDLKAAMYQTDANITAQGVRQVGK